MSGAILGVVLGGGASSRFGAPKGLALVRGKPMALHVSDALSGICADVVIEAAPGAGYEALDLPLCSADAAHAGKGPLAGMIAGLKEAAARGASAAAFAACDMPFLTPAAMHKLAAGPDDAHAAYAITPDGPEPLAAIVKLSALHSLEAMIALDDIPRTHVALDRAGAICIWFSDPAPFRNINTHAELESAGRG